VGNWNFCVSRAAAKYIKFLFQDDLLEPECVAALTAVAEQDPAVGLVSFLLAGSRSLSFRVHRSCRSQILLRVIELERPSVRRAG